MADTILDWLTRYGLEQYAQKFVDEGILTDDQLRDAEVTATDFDRLDIVVKHRRRLREALATLQPARGDLAGARVDLVRRLVAVGISVGFVGRLIQMDWLMAGHFPQSLSQWNEVARLFTAMFLIIVGWEWYHRDVSVHRLDRPFRFAIDLFVILFSVVLLLSSTTSAGRLWLLCIVAIFTLYVLWDAVVIAETTNVLNVPRVYARGLIDRGPRGPATNLSWLVYFAVLWVLNDWVFAPRRFQIIVVCVCVGAGIVALWYDGNKPDPADANRRLGWSMKRRLATIAALVAFYIIFVYLFPYTLSNISQAQAQPQPTLAEINNAIMRQTMAISAVKTVVDAAVQKQSATDAALSNKLSTVVTLLPAMSDEAAKQGKALSNLASITQSLSIAVSRMGCPAGWHLVRGYPNLYSPPRCVRDR